MNWRGMAPPTISSTNSNPPPRGSGSILSQQSPYWPRPPDWRLYLPWASARPLLASLYGTLGACRSPATLNLRLSKFNVEVDLQAPKVPYKEAIKGRAEAQGK